MKCFPCWILLVFLMMYGLNNFLQWVYYTGKLSVCSEASIKGFDLRECTNENPQ